MTHITKVDRKFHKEAREKYNDDWKQLHRSVWLSEIGRSEGDVMMKDDGTEYVLVTFESDHSDVFTLWEEEVVLPDSLQTYDGQI